MAKTAFSPEETDRLKALRSELQDAENDAATAVATDGKAPEKSDDRVAGILNRIREITEAE